MKGMKEVLSRIIAWLNMESRTPNTPDAERRVRKLKEGQSKGLLD